MKLYIYGTQKKVVNYGHEIIWYGALGIKETVQS